MFSTFLFILDQALRLFCFDKEDKFLERDPAVLVQKLHYSHITWGGGQIFCGVGKTNFLYTVNF